MKGKILFAARILDKDGKQKSTRQRSASPVQFACSWWAAGTSGWLRVVRQLLTPQCHSHSASLWISLSLSAAATSPRFPAARCHPVPGDTLVSLRLALSSSSVIVMDLYENRLPLFPPQPLIIMRPFMCIETQPRPHPE